MEGQGAETAAAEAAAVTDQAELYLRYGRNAACCLIGRMICSAYKEGRKHHPSLLQSVAWPPDSAPHKDALRTAPPAVLPENGVRIAVLDIKALCIFLLVRRQLLIGWQQSLHRKPTVQGLRLVNRAVNKRDILYIDAAVQRIGNLHNGAFPHAVGYADPPANPAEWNASSFPTSNRNGPDA